VAVDVRLQRRSDPPDEQNEPWLSRRQSRATDKKFLGKRRKKRQKEKPLLLDFNCPLNTRNILNKLLLAKLPKRRQSQLLENYHSFTTQENHASTHLERLRLLRLLRS
jgi:hypothetical protein